MEAKSSEYTVKSCADGEGFWNHRVAASLRRYHPGKRGMLAGGPARTTRVFGGGLSAFGSAVCDFLQTAEGFVDYVGVGEGFHQLGGDEDDVGSLLDAGAVLATDSFAEVEGGALGERIEFRRLLHIGESRLRWQGGHR